MYDDFGSTWNDLTVYGEKYADGLTGEIAKTPYIRITINSVDYGNLTQEVIDPVTGQHYAYTSGEQFKIIQETINYFFDGARPANIAVLNLTTFLKLLEDQFPPLLDNVTIDVALLGRYDRGLMYDVGLDQTIGGDVFELAKYSVSVGFDPTPPVIVIQRNYITGTVGVQQHIQTIFFNYISRL